MDGEVADRIGVALALASEGVGSLPSVDGRYQLHRVLGRGGFGVVCEAFDAKLQRTIAIKVVDRDHHATDEARSLARLRHPNIVEVFDAESDVELIVGSARLRVGFAALALLDGVTLRAWQRGKNTEELLSIYRGALDGLIALHEHGLIHGDFKPDNVIVVERRPVLVDFGLAKELVPSESLMSMACMADTYVRGTDGYLAPEAYQKQRSRKTDQYAFAASLWEALFGTRPRFGQKADSPNRIASALTKALSVDPADRYASLAELQHVLVREASPRSPVMVSEATLQPRSRTTARLALFGGLGVALLSLGVVSMFFVAQRWVAPSVMSSGVDVRGDGRTPIATEPRNAVQSLTELDFDWDMTPVEFRHQSRFDREPGRSSCQHRVAPKYAGPSNVDNGSSRRDRVHIHFFEERPFQVSFRSLLGRERLRKALHDFGYQYRDSDQTYVAGVGEHERTATLSREGRQTKVTFRLTQGVNKYARREECPE